MKNLFKISLLALVLIVSNFVVKAQDFSSSKEYLGFILEKESLVAEDMWTYIRTSAHSNSENKIQRKKNELIKTIKDASREIALMPPFEGDASLRDSMVLFFNRSVDLLNGDYAEVEELEAKSNSSYYAMKEYLEAQSKANKKDLAANEKVLLQVNQFADDNGIKLATSNSKLSANLKISNVVYDYYNEIYLIFFRGYINETFINDAINKNDTVALKINIDSLTTAYTVGELEIKSKKGYNGDYTLKNACLKAISHYKKEATLYLPEILNFYRVETELDLVKKNYESIPKNDVTQDDINKYNFTISKYNTAAEEYNKTIDLIGKAQQSNANNWSKAVDKFLNTNIPK